MALSPAPLVRYMQIKTKSLGTIESHSGMNTLSLGGHDRLILDKRNTALQGEGNAKLDICHINRRLEQDDRCNASSN